MPGHFLIGRPLTSIPHPGPDTAVNIKDKFEQTRRIIDSFWKKWSMEYVNSLQQKTKWKTLSRNILVGDVVILKETNMENGKCRRNFS